MANEAAAGMSANFYLFVVEADEFQTKAAKGIGQQLTACMYVWTDVCMCVVCEMHTCVLSRHVHVSSTKQRIRYEWFVFSSKTKK